MTYAELYAKLEAILIPYYLIPETLLIPRLIMEMAGINTTTIKPFKSSFNPATMSKLGMDFHDVTPQERKQIMALFHQWGDMTATSDYGYYNRMEEIRAYDTIYFMVDIDKFAEHVIPYLQQRLRSNYFSLSYYQNEASQDRRISRYKYKQSLQDLLLLCEEKYREDKDIVLVMKACRESVDRYNPGHFRHHYACTALDKLFEDKPHLHAYRDIAEARIRMYQYGDYVEPIPFVFHQHKKNMSKGRKLLHKGKNAFLFFKAVTHCSKDALLEAFPCTRKQHKA